MALHETTRGASALITARPARRPRLAEEQGTVTPYPIPPSIPVLPGGWAPLNRDQQEAVLRACDAAPASLIFQVGSPSEAGWEYRVYALDGELWAGVSVVSKFRLPSSRSTIPASRNVVLVGLSCDRVGAVRIAADVLNRELQAHGETWRLGVLASASG